MNVDWTGKDTAPSKAEVWLWVASCTAGLPSPSRCCGTRSRLFLFEDPQCPSSLSGWRDLYHLSCFRASQEELVQALIQGDGSSSFGIKITSSSADIRKNEHTVTTFRLTEGICRPQHPPIRHSVRAGLLVTLHMRDRGAWRHITGKNWLQTEGGGRGESTLWSYWRWCQVCLNSSAVFEYAGH